MDRWPQRRSSHSLEGMVENRFGSHPVGMAVWHYPAQGTPSRVRRNTAVSCAPALPSFL